MSFATNPIGFAAPPCGFRSFPCRFVPDRISFQTSTDILAVFLCGIEPFPCGMKSFRCGNESFQHGNGLQQLHEESIECGDARFFHVELTRYHMEERHSYMEMSLSHVASSRPRFASTFQRLTSGLRGLAWSWNDINSRDSNIAPCLTATDPTFFVPAPCGSGGEKTRAGECLPDNVRDFMRRGRAGRALLLSGAQPGACYIESVKSQPRSKPWKNPLTVWTPN